MGVHVKIIFFIVVCIISSAHAQQESKKELNKLKESKTTARFNFSNADYLAGIKEHGCFDDSDAQTHLSKNCQFLYGDVNKCNSGEIVFRGSDYAICKKYEKKKEKRGAAAN